MYTFHPGKSTPIKYKMEHFHVYFLSSDISMWGFLGPLSDRRDFLQWKLNHSEEVP